MLNNVGVLWLVTLGVQDVVFGVAVGVVIGVVSDASNVCFSGVEGNSVSVAIVEDYVLVYVSIREVGAWFVVWCLPRRA